MKILIVDDQFGIRALLNEIFKKEGYTVFQAANGMQALNMFEEKEPDLVILDMKIPGMNGIEIYNRMKRLQDCVRVIFMTAYSEQEMFEKSEHIDALAYFSKPFDINEMRSTVKNIFFSKK